MFRKEYPPMLMGRPEEQLAQLRAYLVRLIGAVDEALRSTPDGRSEAEMTALTEWQTSVDNSLNALRSYARSTALVLHGTAGESGTVLFPRPFAAPPAVFVTNGAVSDVSETGFTLTTASAAQWIAVGDVRR